MHNDPYLSNGSWNACRVFVPERNWGRQKHLLLVVSTKHSPKKLPRRNANIGWHSWKSWIRMALLLLLLYAAQKCYYWKKESLATPKEQCAAVVPQKTARQTIDSFETNLAQSKRQEASWSNLVLPKRQHKLFRVAGTLVCHNNKDREVSKRDEEMPLTQRVAEVSERE